MLFDQVQSRTGALSARLHIGLEVCRLDVGTYRQARVMTSPFHWTPMFSSTRNILYLGGCLVILVAWLWNCTRKHLKSLQEFPEGPISLPILGNIWTVYRFNAAPTAECRRLARRFPDVCMLWYGRSPAVLINSPRAAHEILHKVNIALSTSINLMSHD